MYMNIYTCEYPCVLMFIAMIHRKQIKETILAPTNKWIFKAKVCNYTIEYYLKIVKKKKHGYVP